MELTIGVDFALKIIEWDENITIRLQMWDIAGQERFGNMTRVYYKEAVGAIITYDISRPASFESVLRWKRDLDEKVHLPDGRNIPCILIATKCDLANDSQSTSSEFLDEFCQANEFIGWFITSAKENINIEESATFLISKILENDKFNDFTFANIHGALRLTNERSKKPENKCFCN
ncbi:ras-related protein Rab-32-like protein [Dinothrombium tinctorium]|uniref:Ras-related protein Rab n=1 Tax=Dinothrombium tinctorium TaxID=1965070 RepID=A0A443QU19_9ACAR|nr:ras-related protein Rab-32-like protein [Dinothrombium tinctorium]